VGLGNTRISIGYAQKSFLKGERNLSSIQHNKLEPLLVFGHGLSQMLMFKSSRKSLIIANESIEIAPFHQ
jgi:hypothetical protein